MRYIFAVFQGCSANTTLPIVFLRESLLFLLLELLFSHVFLWYILQFPLEKTIFSKSVTPVPLLYSFCGEIMKCLICLLLL